MSRYQTLEAGRLEEQVERESFQETVRAGLANSEERRIFTVQPSPERDRVLSVVDRLLDFWWFNVTSFAERPFGHLRFLLRCQKQGLCLAPSILSELSLDPDEYELALSSTPAIMDADVPYGLDFAAPAKPKLEYQAVHDLYEQRFPFRNHAIANMFSDPEHGFSLLLFDRYLFCHVFPLTLAGSELDCLAQMRPPYWMVSFHAKTRTRSLFVQQDWTLALGQDSSAEDLSGYCFSEASTIDAVFRHIDGVLNEAALQAAGSLRGYAERLYPFFAPPPLEERRA